ncbi:flagellar basal body rod protein FlgC [Candidatus Berkiella aquae]|uniref:Flagellar basal-body rod protein FlgC n=1 Tax=Candidatus Berkiella aquae TaxID=295108 RepID=A0A0Q9YL80_9GAMM|nr:flagellar basal body rod protein FlgC [Candidatus Berkiella aquae]MCS5711446.1 flagellar basal body rod protein FlgC [Candidatus Berkiella aquae]
MSTFNIFDVAGMGMSVQSLRLNTIASNLANAESVAGSPEDAYRSRHPVFSTVQMQAMNDAIEDAASVGIEVTDIMQSDKDVQKKYDPNNPKADSNGYVYLSNVNVADQMADMISASRTFQTNAEMMRSAKELMQNIINIGK